MCFPYMCFLWTMTYGINYTLTTVRKLIFSAGHKINRHSVRNIYPPMIQVRIPIEWVIPMNMGMNANTPKNNSMWGNMIFHDFISIWQYWSAHISPSESFVTVSHTDYYSSKFAVFHSFSVHLFGPNRTDIRCAFNSVLC